MIIILSLMMLLLTGCEEAGTDEIMEFRAPIAVITPTEVISFSKIKSLILEPFNCLACHGDMETEAGIENYLIKGNAEMSPLYFRAANGSMPKFGSVLNANELEMLKRFIETNTFTDKSETPKIEKADALITYKEVNAAIMSKSCNLCHSSDQNRIIQLDTYESMKENAEMALLYIQKGFMPMQPRPHMFPVPTDEEIVLLELWIDSGFEK